MLRDRFCTTLLSVLSADTKATSPSKRMISKSKAISRKDIEKVDKSATTKIKYSRYFTTCSKCSTRPSLMH